VMGQGVSYTERVRDSRPGPAAYGPGDAS
jgi:hypothetical protein